jgi:RNA-binding protein
VPKKAVKKKKPRAPSLPLTGKQKSYLRSLAHPLKPVVQIGHQGLTAGVVAALEVALEQHELIKVKVAGECEIDAVDLGPDIEKATQARVAQVIGRTVVLYRQRLQEPKIVLPRVKTQAKAAPARAVQPEPELDDDDDDDDADDSEDLE